MLSCTQSNELQYSLSDFLSEYIENASMTLFDQSFTLPDIPRVFVLAVLEILLSADNAIVLAIITKNLPTPLKKRALYIGFLSAFVFRLVGILLISFLFDSPWIQGLGALYLLYLMFRHFIKKSKKEQFMPHPANFWKTIFLVELFDLAFAVDSIVAGLAFIGTSDTATMNPKLWIVYVGGMIGAFGIRYAAHLFSSVIDRFPQLENSAYLLIGWIGLKLGFVSLSWNFPYLEWIFWAGMGLFFLMGFIFRGKRHV